MTQYLALVNQGLIAGFLAVLLIAGVYRLGKHLDRRRVEHRKAQHHRLLIDLGEARYKVARISAPPDGLITAEDAGRLLPADGWTLVHSMPSARRLRLAYHLDAVTAKVDRALERFLSHERGEASADDVIFELQRLQAYARGLSNEFSTPAARAAAKSRR